MRPNAWSGAFARLTWRLMPEAAIPALADRAKDPGVSEADRKLAVDSLAFITSRESADALISLAAEGSPVQEYARWWLGNRYNGEWASMGLQSDVGGERYSPGTS